MVEQVSYLPSFLLSSLLELLKLSLSQHSPSLFITYPKTHLVAIQSKARAKLLDAEVPAYFKGFILILACVGSFAIHFAEAVLRPSKVFSSFVDARGSLEAAAPWCVTAQCLGSAIETLRLSHGSVGSFRWYSSVAIECWALSSGALIKWGVTGSSNPFTLKARLISEAQSPKVCAIEAAEASAILEDDSSGLESELLQACFNWEVGVPGHATFAQGIKLLLD